MLVARECTYSEFHKYQPLNFKGTEGVTKFPRVGIDVLENVPEESDEVEKYVGGLPDMIQGSVMASKPKTMQDAIEFASELMDQKIRTIAERQTENKRKLDDNASDNYRLSRGKMWLELILLGLSKQEHEQHLKLILKLLKKEQLYAKFSKCEFWIPKLQFLGHVIDSQGIHVDPTKIESIKEWSSPKTATKIRQVFRSCRLFRRFIEGFSKIAKSMTKLTQKKVKYDLGDKEEATF
nr:putative reverse transcriptase domain-containing protein [Tanacetum cinerariifolium]